MTMDGPDIIGSVSTVDRVPTVVGELRWLDLRQCPVSRNPTPEEDPGWKYYDPSPYRGHAGVWFRECDREHFTAMSGNEIDVYVWGGVTKNQTSRFEVVGAMTMRSDQQDGKVYVILHIKQLPPCCATGADRISQCSDVD